MRGRILAAAILIVIALPASAASAASSSATARHILQIAHQVKKERGLQAVLIRVDRGDRTLVNAALGDSMTGVPATPRMHWRIGAMAIPYVTTLLLQLQDRGKLSLDDPVSKWLPNVPRANEITLRMLASATSGYYDYYQGNPAFEALQAANPFRAWKESELLHYAFARGFACEPGTCFNYSHADFILLGKVLRRATGQRVARLMRERIFKPLGLTHTSISSTAAIASPVLHAYSTRTAGGPLEDSTFWNPSWTIGKGEVMTANLRDEARAAPAIGTGRLLSRKAYRELISPPPGIESDPKLFFGLGVVVTSSWIVQNPNISGYVGIQAYLPSRRITIVIDCTNGPTTDENHHWAAEMFDRIGAYLAPRKAPTLPP